MNKKILQLAIPNIISNVTIPLLGLVDMALMGHLNADKYIGAVSLGTVIFNFIYWGFGFLRMSTSGFTAQAFGENNRNESFVILARAMLISTTASLIIILLRTPIGWLSFQLINGSKDVEDLAFQYFTIRIWAAPATLGLYVLNGWFLGMQNAHYPMITSILANVFNIVFSFFFVVVMKMTADGVALGTVIAQYLGLLVGCILFFHKYKEMLSFWDWNAVISYHALKRFFRVNGDIFIRTFCIIAVFTFFTSKSASTDDHILAVNSLLLQFLLFFSFFVDGFAYAGEALAGRYTGEKDRKKFGQLTKNLFRWGTGLALLFVFLFLFGYRIILSILTDQADLIKTALKFKFWIVAMPLLSFASFVWDGIYIGATASHEMRNSMLAATFLLFIPSYLFLHVTLGDHALWLSMLFFMLGRGLFQTILYRRVLIKSFR